MGIVSRIKQIIFVSLRVHKYRWLSDCEKVIGHPTRFQPLLLKGRGKISFGEKVQIGVIASPNFYSHYTYIEARLASSVVNIGNNVAINNGFSLTAFGLIQIGNDVLIGSNCTIVDTDAHQLNPIERHAAPASLDIHIGDNVFLGSNVTILKGVTIGNNSVIGMGSIVTTNIPENVIAAGNPARVIRSL